MKEPIIPNINPTMRPPKTDKSKKPISEKKLRGLFLFMLF